MKYALYFLRFLSKKTTQQTVLIIFSTMIVATSIFIRTDPIQRVLSSTFLANQNIFPKPSQTVSQSGSIDTNFIKEQVTPTRGFQTKIVLGNLVVKMVNFGVIDKAKFETNYKDSPELINQFEQFLNDSSQPLTINSKNSSLLINLLWPLGLSNKMAINTQSPIAGKDVNNYASTGGWSLGKSNEGGIYFNKYTILSLTPDQEHRVKSIADTIHRPCCDNSAFFQDCNHGSAALGLVELGVAQGLSDEEIYKTVLAFNAYWFPNNYTETAIYFKKFKNMDWNTIDPKLILSKDYSSISGWMVNVDKAVQQVPGLLPPSQGGAGCGV